MRPLRTLVSPSLYRTSTHCPKLRADEKHESLLEVCRDSIRIAFFPFSFFQVRNGNLSDSGRRVSWRVESGGWRVEG